MGGQFFFALLAGVPGETWLHALLKNAHACKNECAHTHILCLDICLAMPLPNPSISNKAHCWSFSISDEYVMDTEFTWVYKLSQVGGRSLDGTPENVSHAICMPLGTTKVLVPQPQAGRWHSWILENRGVLAWLLQVHLVEMDMHVPTAPYAGCGASFQHGVRCPSPLVRRWGWCVQFRTYEICSYTSNH